jgi:hypothetical protein
MPRIKITDLPRDKKISREEMKMVMGGMSYDPRLLKIPLKEFLALKPEDRPGAYNTAYFSLRKLVQD